DARSFTARKSTSGAALRNWCNMPVSVATSTESDAAVRAASIIPPVERIFTWSAGTAPSPAKYNADVAQPHSGWMNNSATGSPASRSATSGPLIPAWTWHSPAHTCRFCLAVRLRTCAPRNWSGQNNTSVSCGIEFTTSTAFEDVQHTSVSAFTSAVVFTYDTTTAPGCCAFQSRRSSAVTESASEHPARASGISTVLPGARIFAVSAMKCTPQNTMVEASEAAAIRDNANESPV